ncbi:major capsid protein [Pandoraea communis]|uniref:major capsid protein n=1 Tax=Pandoraea communis TaxID=2508297 RepID=UPI0025A64B13|nr:major capsid protein [Pandoraea communis]MDM8356041.1 major capsid protein [Pandoraea communis]
MKETLERLKTIGARVGVAATVIAVPTVARAEGGGGGGGSGAVDLSAVSSSISFAQVGTAIVAVAASLALIYVGVKGAKIVLGFIRG